jgi:hypothetical protein
MEDFDPENFKYLIAAGLLGFPAYLWAMVIWRFCTRKWDDDAGGYLVCAGYSTLFALFLFCPAGFFCLVLASMAIGMVVSFVQWLFDAVVELKKRILGD